LGACARRAEIIGPLAQSETVGHEAADMAAQALGLSRRQVYVLIRRARQGSGLVTDLVPGQSERRQGKGRLPEPVERIIRELLQKRFLTKQKRSLAAFHREVAQVAKRKSCGCRRATPWRCGSPASIRAKSLAAGKARMRPETSKVWAASLLP
jgi:putative transposase